MEKRKIKYSTERDQDIRAFMRELIKEALLKRKKHFALGLVVEVPLEVKEAG
jgi:hypothetical protein